MKDLAYETVSRVLDTWEAARRMSSDEELGSRIVERYVPLLLVEFFSFCSCWVCTIDEAVNDDSPRCPPVTHLCLSPLHL